MWPYLAGYPEDKIAVIDDTCMMRPSHILGPSASTQVRLVYKPGSTLMRRALLVKPYCIVVCAKGTQDNPLQASVKQALHKLF